EHTHRTERGMPFSRTDIAPVDDLSAKEIGDGIAAHPPEEGSRFSLGQAANDTYPTEPIDAAIFGVRRRGRRLQEVDLDLRQRFDKGPRLVAKVRPRDPTACRQHRSRGLLSHVTGDAHAR